MPSFRHRVASTFRRANVIKAAAIVAVLGVVAGAAIAAQGFDVQKLPINASTIWVLQNGQGERYGQVNTEIAELTTAVSAVKPSRLAQSDEGVFLFSAGDTRFAEVKQGNPVELDEKPTNYTKAPAQTQAVEAGATNVAYLADKGEISLTSLRPTLEGVPLAPVAIPLIDSSDSPAAFSAITLTQNAFGSDVVFAFSAATGSVRFYDTDARSWSSPETLSGAPADGTYQIAAIGETWVVVNSTSGAVWARGQSGSITLPSTEKLQLQGSAPSGSSAFVSSGEGLFEVPLGKLVAPTAPVVSAAGVPTRPVFFGSSVYAAWLSQGTSPGLLYSTADKKQTPLDFNGKALAATPTPASYVNSRTAVINDTASGWVWRIPDGKLVPSSQDWSLIDRTPDQTSERAEVTKVTVPKAPIAENDEFGVRTGGMTALPVLLNDHDANNDVLAIVPDTLTQIPGEFGSVHLSNNGQMVVATMAPTASGTVSFTYQVSDGTAKDGLKSNTASVTLTVHGDENAAPRWCTDFSPTCLQKWPDVQTVPGGTVSVPILDGWVDPDGDRIFIQSVDVDPTKGRARFTSDGQLVFQSEASAGDKASDVSVNVQVADTRGAVTAKVLSIHVTNDPVLALTPFAVSTAVNVPTVVDIAPAARGVTGDLRVVSAKAATDSLGITVDRISGTTFSVSGSQATEAVLSVTFADDGGETNSFVRVSIVAETATKLSTAPVSVFVSPGLDAIVNVFSAAHNPSGRALVVTNVRPSATAQGALSVEPIQGGFLRVRGSSAQGLPGVIGTFTYDLSDGSTDGQFQTKGQGLVYQLAEPPSQPPLGRADKVSVRASGTVDVDVLANDVGSPGVPLVLSAASFSQPDCIPGGLIFAGGGKARIVAPAKAGTYTCPYSMFSSGNPGDIGTSRIVIQVIGAGANSAPQPRDITSRVQAGQSVRIPVTLDGIDPDGDPVSVSSVTTPTNRLGFASLNDERNAIIYTSIPGTSGQDVFTYEVKDSQGATAKATIRVGVTGAEFNPAPITMTDYVEIVAGSGKKAVLSPSENDIDPQNEALTLVADSIKPDAAAGTSIYTSMQAAISSVDGNVVTFVGGEKPATMRFVYEVSNESGSRSTGTIIVKVSTNAAVAYPEVTDTFVTLKELGSLPAGINVVDKKVSWSGGDINALSLSLWGDARGFTASGTKISGTAPREGAIIVFELSGTDFAGNKVSGFGLLHVPSTIDVPLTLDPEKARQQVIENATVSFNMSDLISLPAGVSLEVNGDKVASLGQRQQAKCSVQSGTSVTYTAGAGAPWQDGCIVPVRIAGTSQAFTDLMVPITVTPLNPEPELSRRQLTVVPGDSLTVEFNLTTMTAWYGRTDLSSLQYSIDNQASNNFKVSLSGQILTITAFGSATTGAQGNVIVRISNHPNTAPAPLVLVVGGSPNGSPVGGSLTKSCSADNPECVMGMGDVVGAYNPQPEVALRFAPFNFTGGVPDYSASSNAVRCGGVTIRAEADRLVATWATSPLPESTSCNNIGYRVLDKDGKSGPGTLSFTLEGTPGSPGKVTQSRYTDSTITILIEAGSAGQSQPRTTEFVIYEGDSVVSTCSLGVGAYSASCELQGLEPYDGRPEDKADLHTYVIRAKNGIGESSRSKTLANAYAYEAPVTITSDVFVSVTPIFSGKYTSALVGVATTRIRPINDPIVSRYRIKGEGQPEVIKTMTDFSEFSVDVLAKPGTASKITVEALGRVGPPGGIASPLSTASWTGTIAGSPSLEKVEAASSGSRAAWSAKITATKATRNYSTKEAKFLFVVWEDTAGATTPKCTWDPATNNITVSGSPRTKPVSVGVSDQQSVPTVVAELSGLTDLTGYRAKACFTNGFGLKELSSAAFGTLSDPDAGVYSYAVSSTPVTTTTGAEWRVELSNTPTPPGTVTAQFSGGDGWKPSIYSTTWGAQPTIKVRYCLSASVCSAGDRLVTNSDATRAWQLKITSISQTVASGAAYCQPSTNLSFQASGPNLGSGTSRLWKGDRRGGGITRGQYFDGTTWQDLAQSLNFFQIPAGATALKLKLFVSGSPVAAVQGLTGEAQIEVQCRP